MCRIISFFSPAIEHAEPKRQGEKKGERNSSIMTENRIFIYDKAKVWLSLPHSLSRSSHLRLDGEVPLCLHVSVTRNFPEYWDVRRDFVTYFFFVESVYNTSCGDLLDVAKINKYLKWRKKYLFSLFLSVNIKILSHIVLSQLTFNKKKHN